MKGRNKSHCLGRYSKSIILNFNHLTSFNTLHTKIYSEFSTNNFLVEFKRRLISLLRHVDKLINYTRGVSEEIHPQGIEQAFAFYLISVNYSINVRKSNISWI